MIDPIIGGALIKGGVSLLSGLFGAKSQSDANATNLQIARENNEMSQKIARENNEFQLSAMRENNEFNRQQAIDMFNMENTYNTPLAQLQRLREAGINPAVALGGNTTSIANTGNAQTPTASGSGVSPQLPSLTTPQVQSLPNVVSGSLNALSQLSQIALNKSNARKSDADASSTLAKIDAEVNDILADARLKQAQTDYSLTMRNLELLYGDDERLGKIKEMSGNYILSMSKSDESKANKELLAIEKELKSSQNEQIKQQLPFIVENLKKTGRQIDAVTRQTNAQTNQINENTALIKLQQKAQTLQNGILANDFSLSNQTLTDRVNEIIANAKAAKNLTEIQRKEIDKLQEEIERARKENNTYYYQLLFGNLMQLLQTGATLQNASNGTINAVGGFFGFGKK